MLHRLLLLGCLLVATACTSKPGGTLTLTSLETQQVFSQPFAHAYFSTTDTGDYHIVLINDHYESAASKDPHRALQPTPTPPTRQLIHIHVLWQPMPGTRADSPSATNAAIDWYILGLGTDHHRDLLHYQGAGFVTLRGEGDLRTITLRNTTLQPTRAKGNMTDRLGQTSLQGRIIATYNPARVEALLSDAQASP
jgi:hypothetical protein